MLKRTAVALILSIMMVGCFQSHELYADGGVRPSPADTGPAPFRDASPPLDAATPLPVEPEPDLGPDARPSDYPDAGGWTDPDPSAFPDSNPCCTPAGPEHTIEMGGDGGLGTVALEWNGREWGLLYTDSDRTVFVPLGPLGDPGTHRLLPTTHNIWADLVWGGGRFGVALSTESGELLPNYTATFMLIDERGTLASELTVFSPAYRVAMARMTHLDRWAAAWTTPDGRVLAQEMDGAARLLGDPVVVSASHPIDVMPRLVGLKSRIVTFYVTTHDGGANRQVAARTLTSPFADSSAEEQVVLENSRSAGLGATAFRNVALVSEMTRDSVRVGAFDPFDGVVTARAMVTDWGPARGIALGTDIEGTGLGASDGRGLVAICVPVSEERSMDNPDPPATIRLFLLGPDLEQLGAPVDVGQIADVRIPSCEVGFSNDNILVAWWNRSQPRVHVRAYRP